MTDYPWWVIPIDDSTLSSTCFTLWLYSSLFFAVVSLCVAAWRTAAGAVPDHLHAHEFAIFAVIAGLCWVAVFPVAVFWLLWRALVPIMRRIQETP